MTTPEIDTSAALPGTVKFYNRHLIVCLGHTEWPSQVESEGFTAELNNFMQQTELADSIKITACDIPSNGEGHDVLIYPDNIKVKGLSKALLPSLYTFLGGNTTNELVVEHMASTLLFVCSHGTRDERCGVCGPKLHEVIETELANSKFSTGIILSKSSHLGGHHLAGVVLIYPSGNWYGRVNENNIKDLLHAELVENKPYKELWRGRIGLTVLEQREVAKNF